MLSQLAAKLISRQRVIGSPHLASLLREEVVVELGMNAADGALSKRYRVLLQFCLSTA